MITLIKDKRFSNIKGHTCADGRPTHRYIKKEDNSLTTMTMEELASSIMIYSAENMDVVIFDVLGAYLWADIPKYKTVL